VTHVGGDSSAVAHEYSIAWNDKMVRYWIDGKLVDCMRHRVTCILQGFVCVVLMPHQQAPNQAPPLSPSISPTRIHATLPPPPPPFPLQEQDPPPAAGPDAAFALRVDDHGRLAGAQDLGRRHGKEAHNLMDLPTLRGPSLRHGIITTGYHSWCGRHHSAIGLSPLTVTAGVVTGRQVCVSP
jgi:hypothetical protein